MQESEHGEVDLEAMCCVVLQLMTPNGFCFGSATRFASVPAVIASKHRHATPLNELRGMTI